MSHNGAPLTRRDFLGATAGMTLMSAARAGAWSRVKGANDRVRMALIGCGTRGTQVSNFFLRHPDIEYVAATDVFKTRLDARVATFAEMQGGARTDAFEDYRRVLDRKDIDAVHVASPDHWHCQILIDAIAAGKDVYVEKPLSNQVDRAVQALQAYRASNRVVQLGTQQRSGQHFQEAAEIVRSGQLGKVTHALIAFPGTGYGRGPEQVTDPPAALNWEMFQGPAPRRPYKQSRQTGWRGWWDYGGGLITDWGVHLTDIALWYLNSQHAGPSLTSGVGQYVNLVNPDHDQSPDAFVVSWQYPDFLMSFTNATPLDQEFGRQGNYFFGPRGSLLVHRGGYEVRPAPQRPGGGRGGRQGGPGAGAPGALPAAAPAPQAQPAPEPLAAKRVPYAENYADDPHTIAHARNFLDCIKSRQKPVSDLEIGFYATLPCLLGVMAVREGRSFKWDNQALKAAPV
jgi:predicted dehydrogenase